MMETRSEKNKKNKSGVTNSLVNNINARKKDGTSRTKKKSTVSREQYDKMEHGWKRKEKQKQPFKVIDPRCP
jgi:hypothetical protein